MFGSETYLTNDCAGAMSAIAISRQRPHAGRLCCSCSRTPRFQILENFFSPLKCFLHVGTDIFVADDFLKLSLMNELVRLFPRTTKD